MTVVAIAATVLVCAGGARPATGDAVTVSIVAFNGQQRALTALIGNFERVYPEVTIEATYVSGNTNLYQIESTELLAGNAPDLLDTFPGCGTPISICALAKAGDLAPMIKAPWAKRSLPLVTSAVKHDGALYAFEPEVQPYGIVSNDDLLRRLGQSVPETFAQLLHLCQVAKNAGTAGFVVDPSQLLLADVLTALAIPIVYGSDRHWNAELKTGRVSFDGSGWRQALQEFVEMDNAGCFEPGATGASGAQVFSLGQGVEFGALSNQADSLATDGAQFPYSFTPFPSGTAPGLTTTFLNLAPSISVNAHSSVANQAAAQTFVNFLARPKENALYAQLDPGISQYELLKGQLPSFLSSFAPVFTNHRWVINPQQTWWNAGVQAALFQDGIGLLTGQETPDGILQAMDAAWKQGPS